MRTSDSVNKIRYLAYQAAQFLGSGGDENPKTHTSSMVNHILEAKTERPLVECRPPFSPSTGSTA